MAGATTTSGGLPSYVPPGGTVPTLTGLRIPVGGISGTTSFYRPTSTFNTVQRTTSPLNLFSSMFRMPTNFAG